MNKRGTRDFAEIYIETFIENKVPKRNLMNEILFLSFIGAYVYFFIHWLDTKINLSESIIAEIYHISVISILIIIAVYKDSFLSFQQNVTTYVLVALTTIFSTFSSILVVYFWLIVLYDLMQIDLIVYYSNSIVQVILNFLISYPIYNKIIKFLEEKNRIPYYNKNRNFKIITFVIFIISVLTVVSDLENFNNKSIITTALITILLPYYDLLKKFG